MPARSHGYRENSTCARREAIATAPHRARRPATTAAGVACKAVPMAAQPDRWSRWLLERRHAGDESQRDVVLDQLEVFRDGVLALAEPLDGATVLDVGTGDGLIAREALKRVGPRGRVIFSDISQALLDRAREAAGEQAGDGRAQFVLSRADSLAEIADASVDVATTRSVLIYVADKQAAFGALHRVLRAGGRISLFEPINRLMFPEPDDRLWGYDVASIVELAAKVKASYSTLREPAADTMMDFDERDLVRFAETAGFARIHLECHIDIEPAEHLRAISLETLLDIAPSPLAPTLREALHDALDAPERERFLAHLAREVEDGEPIRRTAVAYLAARKLG
jgi:arsenite methyltransferase